MSEDTHKYDPHEHEPMPEGEEEAPPYTHTMAIVRWVILGGMTLFALVMILSYFGATPWSGGDSAPTQYHCPMHPTYVSNQPGDCPICGMTLVPIDAAGKEIKTGDSAVTAPSQHEAEDRPRAKPGQYTCPMDPEVISDSPGKCPICGMNLEQVPPATSSVPQDDNMSGMAGMSGMSATTEPTQHDASDMGSSPVAGLVPVTIEPQRLQLIGVRTGTVSKRSLDGSLRLVGYITPDETRLSNIHVRFSGWVKELSIDQTGQQVSANQKLLSVYSQDLFQAENEYIIARNATGRTADNALKETRNRLLSAARQRLDLLGVPPEEILRLDTASSPNSELWIRSPFSGFVLEKNVVTGQFIGPDQNLFTIADLSRVWVLADVYERDLASLKIGQTARMTTSAYPGESFEGKVSFLYPSVSEQTRTLKIRIEFANSSNRLKPGMYAEVDLAGEGTGVLAVPADAVMDGGDRQYAFVVHDGTHFEPRLLKLGRSSDDYFEVLSGLAEGEQVVTSANFLIDSESRLKAAIAGMGSTQPDAHAGHGK
jgi:Cu(I)/Ag(I) efflux system membrane fusion protein